MTDGVDRFFAYARERYRIMLRRRAGQPAPWTDDPVLSQYRFCNIFREDDTVTIWLRENVRERLRSSPDVLLAVVLFRWFNRVRAGEAIFSQTLLDLGTSPAWGTDALTAWDAREGLSTEDWIDLLRSSVRSYCGRGPYVTGSYIIKTPDGMDKLDGVLQCVQWFMEQTPTVGDEPHSWRALAEGLLELRHEGYPVRLRTVWQWLRQFPYMGDFMAYEVVTDLAHTDLLDRAPDIMLWANPGPGATRGLGRVLADDPARFQPRQKAQLNNLMVELLVASRSSEYWPQQLVEEAKPVYLMCGEGQVSGEWPMWDMRTVEHTLCEFDKYERARLGQGRPRQRLRHGA